MWEGLKWQSRSVSHVYSLHTSAARRSPHSRKLPASETDIHTNSIHRSSESARSPSPDAMADSEADAPASPADEDAPLFPLEGRFLNTTDRADILALPEIERETILADRAAQVTRRQQDLQLKRALAATREKAKSHKRKAAAADLEDDGAKRNNRPKVEKTGKTALDAYRQAREERGAGKKSVDTGRRRRDSRSPSTASDRDADGESEVEYADTYAEPKHDEPPAELRDFERVRVGRSNFARVCFYPDFETAIKGCFTRVAIGPDRQTGQNVYRMTQIKGTSRCKARSPFVQNTDHQTGFTEGKPYQLTGANGKTFTSDQYCILAHGRAEKPWPFLACSDSNFTPAEYERYISTLRKDNVQVPSRKTLKQRLDGINALLNRQWTEDDIQNKINKQRAMADKYSPANQAKLQMEKLTKRRTIAEEEGDDEEVARCDAEIATLQNGQSNGNAHPKTASPAKPGKSEKQREQDRLAALNTQTRRTNAEEVRKALVEEKRKLARAREKAIAEAKAKAAAAAAAANGDGGLKVSGDLFGEGSDASRAATPVNGTPKASRAGTPAVGGVKALMEKKKGPLGAVRGGRGGEDEVLGGMDLGMDDIEI